MSQTASNSLWQIALQRLRANRIAMAAFAWLVLLTIAVILGPMLSRYSVAAINFDGLWGTAPSLADGHWFGTDSLGRDVFVRTLSGGRISLLVGLTATTVSLLIGVSYGAIAGYFGGKIDEWMMRFVDILYALPFMFLVILLMVMFGRNVVLIFVAIGAINWLDMARIVRGQTMALRQREFVQAAVAGGEKNISIIRNHIVPNLLGVVAVYITLTIPHVILTESFLSFLGLGVQEPNTSWGALVNDGAREMEQTPWSLLFPAGLMATTLMCFNLLGDGLRDALDLKTR